MHVRVCMCISVGACVLCVCVFLCMYVCNLRGVCVCQLSRKAKRQIKKQIVSKQVFTHTHTQTHRHANTHTQTHTPQTRTHVGEQAKFFNFPLTLSNLNVRDIVRHTTCVHYISCKIDVKLFTGGGCTWRRNRPQCKCCASRPGVCVDVRLYVCTYVRVYVCICVYVFVLVCARKCCSSSPDVCV